jgi:glycosyltransferase involved in cell wall biosynthesis
VVNTESKPRTRYFTICGRSDLAQAAVLCESLARHHPTAGITIWILDTGPIPPSIGVSSRYIRPIDECLSKDEQIRVWLRYGADEFLEVVKPFCFLKHFEEADEVAIFIDRLTNVYCPLAELEALVHLGAAGVLVPRYTTPRVVPSPAVVPAPLAERGGHVFDRGLLALGVSPSAHALLDWWIHWFKALQKLELGNDVSAFLEQLDGAPYLWPGLRALSNAGYQVANWNISERQLVLAARPEGIIVGDSPLVSVYFGALERRGMSSASADFETRVGPEHPILTQLVAEYCRAVDERGFLECRLLQRPGLIFEDGHRFDLACYQAYRTAQKRGIAFQSVHSNGPGSFREWLAKFESGRPFPNYVDALFELRRDVEAEYKHAPLASVMRWIEVYGSNELGLDPGVLSADLDVPVPQSQAVSYIGYVTAEVGLGEAARGYIRALEAEGCAVDTLDVSDTLPHKRSDQHLRPGTTPGIRAARIQIIHVNADALPVALSRVSPQAGEHSYRIGIWAWETPEFPEEWRDRFGMLDEIWVGSEFMARSISAKAPIPVLVMPHVIHTPVAHPDRQLFGLDPDEFIFLLMFDFYSVMERKNPLGAVEAFQQAFSYADPVRLFVKSMHGETFADAYAHLRKAAEGSRVTFLDGTLTSTQRFALLSSCDAFLSLHRAEGFGLGLAECMAMGKPVIATAWSGNMDFMNHQNSVLVDYTLEVLATDAGPYKAGTRWAEPDIADAADKMRQLWLNPDEQLRIGARAQSDIATGYSAATVGRMVRERLHVIAETRQPLMASTTSPSGWMAGAMPSRRTAQSVGLGAVRRVRRAAKVLLKGS